MLKRMVEDHATGLAELQDYLDGLSHPHRLEETRTLNRAAQRALFNKAENANALMLEDFVPTDRGSLRAVRHHGKNTLPVLAKHRLFEKRFARGPDASKSLLGYNEAPSGWLIGPGYFVAYPTEGRPAWEARGSVVIDYFKVPSGPVVPGWPKVIPNNKGLQRFVYHRTRDFMRKVSTHVSIGLACKEEKSLDHYFVLCREP